MFHNTEEDIIDFLGSGHDVGRTEGRRGQEGCEVERHRKFNVTVVLAKAAHSLLESVETKTPCQHHLSNPSVNTTTERFYNYCRVFMIFPSLKGAKYLLR